jgi:hypothetical protein
MPAEQHYAANVTFVLHVQEHYVSGIQKKKKKKIQNKTKTKTKKQTVNTWHNSTILQLITYSNTVKP